MAKIIVELNVDEEQLMKVNNREMETAITSELGWLADSGLFLESWQFREDKEIASKENISTLINEHLELPAKDILSNAINEMERAKYYLEEYVQFDTDGISPEEELVGDFSVSIERLNHLISVIDSLLIPQIREESLTINTPIGDIIVTPSSDPNYPGVYVDLKGENINDSFEVNTTSLAAVEYDIENKKVQTHVYGDSLRDEPTISVEHGNYLKKSLSKMIAEAGNRKGADGPEPNEPAKSKKFREI